MEEVEYNRFGQLAEKIARYIGGEILGGRKSVKCRFSEEGLEFYNRGAAPEFVDMVGALMKGCIDMGMTK